MIDRLIGKIIYDMRRVNTILVGKYLTAKVGGEGRLTGNVNCDNIENIFIGKNSFVNGGDLYAGKKSKIVIGDNCMISYNVHIRTTYHNYRNRDIPMNQQGMEEKDVIIENNCWIGHSAHIMAGVTIHTGSVVGANSVVTHDVPPNTVVGGVPARVIANL